ncbi:MAG TPA: hypothetical protein EYN71_08305 [Flavobacteriales bacterium]|nr:hypothetical protein [Flavobacteriales bacterium]
MISQLFSKSERGYSTVYIRAMIITLSAVLTMAYPVNAGDEGEKVVPIFKVYEISGCNSKGLDFSPVVIGDKLVFVSERAIDLINYGETGYSKRSYLTIQYSTIKNANDTITYSMPKLFSGRICQLQHSGPISFDLSGEFAVFTRVKYYKSEGGRIFRPQLFSTKLQKNRWREIELLNINSPKYSFGHPALSSDGKTLYFVSDMEGGYGGKDIYRSEHKEGVWSDPVNLGPKVNTVGNEAFPFLYRDSLFFFSSDGHPGYGGLDLHYSVLENGNITTVTHLDSSINSTADDFGFFLNQDQNTGYFSSNRSGAQKDDIYGFSIKWMKPSEMPKTIRGIFKYQILAGKSADSLRVYLVNDLGEIVYTAYTNEGGDFEFTNLPYNHDYIIRTDSYNKGLILILLDDGGNSIAELAVNEKGEFLYKKLSYKEMGGLQFLYTTDSIQLVENQNTKSLSGKLAYRTLPYKSAEGMKIFLINEAGDIVYTALVGRDGYFEFKNLSYAANYIIMTEEYDPDLALLIFNDGETVAELISTPAGKFLYIKLPHSSATTLALIDISTGEDFRFIRGLESDNWLQDRNAVAIASPDNLSAYVYYTLGIKNVGALTSMVGAVSGFCPDTYNQTVEETAECIEMTIDELLGEVSEVSTESEVSDIETIYFGKNSSYIAPEDSILLKRIVKKLHSDNNLQVESHGYSDIDGTSDYNLWISKQRADRVANYLISRGISPDRITTKGWGEAKRMSKCTVCTVEEMRVDRRAEIKIY